MIVMVGFFSGDITFIEAAYIWTLSFHRGQCIDYIHGIPHSGTDIGVKGDHKAWAQFFTHKSLSVATNSKHLVYKPIEHYGHFIIVEAPKIVCSIIDSFVTAIK